MGLFDDSDGLGDDDYIDVQSNEDDESELGADYHISAQPPRPVEVVSKIVKTSTNKKLPEKFKKKGVIFMLIRKANGKEVTFS